MTWRLRTQAALYRRAGDRVLAKIALELERAVAHRNAAGNPGNATPRAIARGQGWSVEDVICTSGPKDRTFEERHSYVAIAMVAAGSFQYRSETGHELMTPGSLLLGNAGQCFECSHEHGIGDRCLAFHYSPEYFERLAVDAGVRGKPAFGKLRVPPLRSISPLIARALAGLAGNTDPSWEELSIQIAARTLRLVRGLPPTPNGTLPNGVARVTRVIRLIDRDPDARHTLADLAGEAGLSPYYFLRTFEHLTGLTPHQYVRRTRLREAALRLMLEPARVIDIAFDCGFGDVSNFNRAFRAEFGLSPRAYRRHGIRLSM
jgi:AraC family transcriptional regulator